jgi:hypothetical protein
VVSQQAAFTGGRSSLRILQWNADGIRSGLSELEERLQQMEIDVAVIQETKLRRNNATPKFEGYATIRHDRANEKQGGGLLSLVKNDLSYEAKPEWNSEAQGTEWSRFRVRVGRQRWITITNVYIPPNRSGESDDLQLEQLTVSRDAFCAGDFNGHSPMWDAIQPEDARGALIADWMADNDLICCNELTPTRTNRSTGNGSSPDIFIAPACWADALEWCTLEDMGSDHLPILIVATCDVSVSRPPKSSPRWKRGNVDWTGFGKAVEEAPEWRKKATQGSPDSTTY